MKTYGTPGRRVSLGVMLLISGVMVLEGCDRAKSRATNADVQTGQSGQTEASGLMTGGPVSAGPITADASNGDTVARYSQDLAAALDSLNHDVAGKKISGQEFIDRFNAMPDVIGLASPTGSSVPDWYWPYLQTFGQRTAAAAAPNGITGKISKSTTLIGDGGGAAPSTPPDSEAPAEFDLPPPPEEDFVKPGEVQLPQPPPLPEIPGDIDPMWGIPKVPPPQGFRPLPPFLPPPPKPPKRCSVFGVPGKCCGDGALADQCTIYFAIPVRLVPPLYYFGSCQWKRDVGFVGCPNVGRVTGWRCPPRDPNAC